MHFKQSECQAWTTDISCYKVFDEKSNQFLGLFYLDLYPREGKFNHAAVFPLVQRSVVGDDVKRASAAMVVNFDPSKDGQPSLMHHNEVKTFFHEFGHVMHNMCSTANFARFAGNAVEKDFVELPSQMLENWVWDKNVLKRLGKHYESGEPLPDELIQKKLDSRLLFEAYAEMGQLFQSTFDFIIHSASENSTVADGMIAKERVTLHKKHEESSQAIWAQLKLDIMDMSQLPNTNPAASFGHLFSGYESNYYGYLWSHVYASDLFSEFKRKGIMNKELGMRYRQMILAPGGT